MTGTCHWRDLPYRAVKALRGKLHVRFPRLGEAAVARRFHDYPGSGAGDAASRSRVLAAAGLSLWPEDPDAVPNPDTETRLRIIGEAGRILNHRFDVLGSGLVDYGNPIRWHLDIKSGFQWAPDAPWRLARRQTPEGADIKVPWELSRCHQFVTLGVAWQLDPDESIWLALREQITDWISANPYPCGVNWACPMDVAIRLVNWLTALGLFHERLARLEPDDSFFNTLDRSIWEHGWHVSRHLEASGPRCPRGGNHLYADLCGLLVAGLYFIRSRAGSRWLAMARAGIETQTLRQFEEDGGPSESSTSYHRLLLEMALWAEALLDKHGMPLSPQASERITAALGFARDTCDPDGNSPNIGDNDSGRLLVVLRDQEEKYDYFWRHDQTSIGGIHQVLLTVGTRALSLPVPLNTYPVAGFHILRSKFWHVCVRAGRIGHGGAHAHCDQLSLVASFDGSPFLVDPGSYVYTPDPATRNRFRSGASHNIARPEGVEQCTLGEGPSGVFSMRRLGEARIIRTKACPDGGLIEGRFNYHQDHGSIEWTRTIELEGHRLTVRDTLLAPEGTNISWRYHHAPGIGITRDQRLHMARAPGMEVDITLPDDIASSNESGAFSGGYGRKTPIRVIHLEKKADTEGKAVCEVTFSGVKS